MTPEALLAHYDKAAPWPSDRSALGPTDVAAAYQDALALRALRLARGERPVGYKIGFTNRTIWQRYGVFGPIWGPVWNTTLTRCDGRGTVDLTGTLQPRIEPEIVFGMAATPPRDATLEQLFGCIEWLAPGFEIVQSHSDWKFTAAETVADGALHARLLVGRETPIRQFARTGAELDDKLAATHLKLLQGRCDDRRRHRRQRARRSAACAPPLRARTASCPGAPALQPGEVITTGTWTDAWPIVPGETWRAEFEAPFDSLEVTLR
jgi:2-keto-4-pentenoate hydratase